MSKMSRLESVGARLFHVSTIRITILTNMFLKLDTYQFRSFAFSPPLLVLYCLFEK